jgi:hypothetical protein
MRTHLPRTTYPAPAEMEFDIGIASNDSCYDGPTQATAEQPDFQPVQLRNLPIERIEVYELGGYAGI